MDTKKYIMLVAIVLMLAAIIALPIIAAVFIGDRLGAGTGMKMVQKTGGGSSGGWKGNCLNVPYIQQGGNNANFRHSWCGRASQAMLAAFFNVGNSYYESFDFQNSHPLKLETIRSTTGKNYSGAQTKDIDGAIQSIKNGYPVIVETDLYGQHIFVLTGYDEASQTFAANDTFGCSTSNCPSKTCTTSIDGKTLTRDTLKDHLAKQGAYFYLVR